MTIPDSLFPIPDSRSALDIVAADLLGFANDPEGFVYYAFPWGGGELAEHPGPDDWQLELLRDVGRRMRDGARASGEVIQEAVVSGNGVGKSAVVAWLILWAMSTYPKARGVVTANSATQLATKTWPELAKWHELFIGRAAFVFTATSLYAKGQEKQWRFDCVPWSMHSVEAFQGLHNQGRRAVMIFDEASAIVDAVWEAAEFSLTDTDTDLLWFVFGNGTRGSGRFRRCFGDLAHRWTTHRVDARAVRVSNKSKIAKYLEDYGEDSDLFRVRVRGEFPRAADMQFFGTDLVAAARRRLIAEDSVTHLPGVLGLDVAGTGRSKTVLSLRRGQRILWQRKELYTPDQMQLAGRIVDLARAERNIRCICVDANGIGKGVADRLAELHEDEKTRGQVPFQVIHVFGANAARDTAQYKNLRAELHGRFREWLRGGQIPDEADLEAEMTGIEYGFTATVQVVIESKESMIERGLHSPDLLDSACLTFADDLYETLRSRSAVRALELAPRRKLVW